MTSTNLVGGRDAYSETRERTVLRMEIVHKILAVLFALQLWHLVFNTVLIRMIL